MKKQIVILVMGLFMTLLVGCVNPSNKAIGAIQGFKNEETNKIRGVVDIVEHDSNRMGRFHPVVCGVNGSGSCGRISRGSSNFNSYQVPGNSVVIVGRNTPKRY